MRFSVPYRTAYLICIGFLVLASGLLVLMEGGSRIFPTGIWVTTSSRRIILDVVITLTAGGTGWLVCSFYGFGSFATQDSKKPLRSILFTASATGAITGILLISLDLILSNLHYRGSMPHPPPATALLSTPIASGVHELLFRLIFLGGGCAVLQKTGISVGKSSFWFLAFLSVVSAFFLFIPFHGAEYGIENISDVPAILIFHYFLFYALTGLVCAAMFYRHGFFAAWGTHFTALFVWDVLWGQVWWRCLF